MTLKAALKSLLVVLLCLNLMIEKTHVEELQTVLNYNVHG